MTLLIPFACLAALVAAVQWSLPWWVAALPAGAGLLALTLARRPAHVVLGLATVVAALAILRADSASPPPSELSRALAERQVTALRGAVADEPAPRDRAQLARLRVTAARFAEGDWRVLDGTAHATARLTPPLHYGEILEVRGRVQTPEAGAPAGYASYLRRQGIDAVVSFPTIEHRGTAAGSPVQHMILALRSALTSSLERNLPEPHASLAQGILLGRRATMPPDLTESMRLSGLSHLTAVSGYNVSLVVGLVVTSLGLGAGRGTGRAGRAWLPAWRRLIEASLASAALWFFVALVGASGSVLRAAAMAQLALLGRATDRAGSAGGLLLWGSAALALWQPSIVTDIGWQLSFLGTAGLAWLASPLQRRLAWLPSTLRPALAGTLAAQVFVLPILVSTFGSVALVAPLANVLALPLVTWIMAGSGMSAVCGALAPLAGAAPFFAALAWVPLSLLLWVAEWTAALPWASATLPPPSPAGVTAYLAALVALCGLLEVRAASRSPDDEPARFPGDGSLVTAAPMPLRRRALVTLAAALAALACVGFAMAQPLGSLSDSATLVIDIPHVADGTLTLLQSPGGARVLIDGGPAAGGAVGLLGRHVRPWDRSLEAIVAADPREQHITGLPRVLERYRVGTLIHAVDSYPSSAYRHVRDTAARQRVPVLSAAPGETLTLGSHGPALTPLSEPGVFPMSLRLDWGAFSALLPGDTSPAQLRALLASDHDLRVSVLILPVRLLRHPETARLLRAADPDLVVVQGAPAAGTVHPTDDEGLPTAWHHTATDGALTLRVHADGAFRRSP